MIKLTDVALINIGEKYSLKQVILEDFKKDLPIAGGWGYNFTDAIIIKHNSDSADNFRSVNAVDIEYYLVEKRLYEELIIFKQDSNKFSGINWKLLQQILYSENGKKYDYLQFEVTCFKDNDWNKLKNEYEAGITNPEFDLQLHKKHREELTCHFITEYYFDISDFLK